MKKDVVSLSVLKALYKTETVHRVSGVLSQTSVHTPSGYGTLTG